MIAHKHVPVLRAVFFSLALLLAAAIALSANAFALSSGTDGTDAVTGASPRSDSGEMPQFSGGQSLPQMPDGEMPQFSDGQSLPQMPGDDGSDSIQQAPAADDEASADAESEQRKEAGYTAFSRSDGSRARSGSSGFQVTSLLWMLLGFGCALILCSIGIVIFCLVRHRRSRNAANWNRIR